MNKILCIVAAAAVCPAIADARADSIPDDPYETHERPILESLAKIEKKTDKFNLYLNMHADFDAEWKDATFERGKFQMRQLRIEARGNINSWLSYRYRQRLNNGDFPSGYNDNIMRSIDYAAVGIRLGKWHFLLGKQCSAWGGIEFDINPIEIYQYSDMVGSINSFLTGVDVCYNFSPRQQLHVQMVNSYARPLKEEYGDYEAAKMPFMYSVNWNGSFWNGTFKTRWSASVMEQAKGHQAYYFALGNEFNINNRFGAYFDWMYARDGIDRRGIITDIVGGSDRTRNATDASYMSYVLHLNYRFAEKWNVFAKVMLENEGVFRAHSAMRDGSEVNIPDGKYRTAWGYIGGIEYYPMRDSNLHFFACYVGRDYKYTACAKAFGADDYSTSRIAVGFIWHMPVF